MRSARVADLAEIQPRGCEHLSVSVSGIRGDGPTARLSVSVTAHLATHGVRVELRRGWAAERVEPEEGGRGVPAGGKGSIRTPCVCATGVH